MARSGPTTSPGSAIALRIRKRIEVLLNHGVTNERLKKAVAPFAFVCRGPLASLRPTRCLSRPQSPPVTTFIKHWITPVHRTQTGSTSLMTLRPGRDTGTSAVTSTFTSQCRWPALRFIEACVVDLNFHGGLAHARSATNFLFHSPVVDKTCALDIIRLN